ncbi:hypothetical protein I4F81_004957 [Pyropia yezoensis]|uniref:Uncharacterized protein n=1 Tax=Pyropia yezoensis TaxID=2788 RepID=A0ACC3BXS7_PYRYE|nr:hypothetical protein I4F81_004957 [Neopyropia yezoensis]
MSVCAGTQTGAERVVGGKGWGKAHQRPPPPALGRVFCRRGVWSPHASPTDAGGSGGGGEGLGWWDGDQWLLTMPSPLSGGYKSCSGERAVRGVPISIPSHRTHRTCIYPPTRSSPPLASALPRAPRQPLPPPTRPPRSTTTTPNTLPTRPSTFVMAPSRRTLSTVAASAVAVTAVLALAASIAPATATPITEEGVVAAAPLSVTAPAAAADWQADAVGDDASTDWEPAVVVGDTIADEAAADDGAAASVVADVDAVTRTADDVDAEDELDAAGKVDVRTMDEEVKAEDETEAQAELAEDLADADTA